MLGILVALLVIIAPFAVTALYVQRANTDYDALTQDIIEKVG